MTSWRAETVIAGWQGRMSRVPQALRDAAKAQNKKTATEMAKRLKRNLHKGPDAPHLVDTIQVLDGDQNKLEAIVRIGDAASPYAIPLEFGHDNAAELKFYRPVVRIMRKKHKAALRRAIRNALKRLFP